MGIFDFLDFLKKKDKDSTKPFSITTKLHPYRLNAYRNEIVDLIVTITNNDSKPNMVSVVAKCPQKLGFGSIGINKSDQKKIGNMEPGEEKTVIFKIHGNSNTEANDYPIGIMVYSHFRDYEHVENAVRKIITLRAV